MATHTVSQIQNRLPVLAHRNGLMSPVRAGDHAASAADAGLSLKAGIDYRVPLQDIRRGVDRRKAETPGVPDAVKALLSR